MRAWPRCASAIASMFGPVVVLNTANTKPSATTAP
jgi:hypothetical protein